MILVLAVPVVALLLLGRSVQTPTAEAKPTAIVTINSTLCLALTVEKPNWADPVEDLTDADKLAAVGACTGGGLQTEASMRQLVTVLGGDPDHPKPSDFTSIDTEAGQLHEMDGRMWIIAFVKGDDPVAFYADQGFFTSAIPSPRSDIACGPSPGPGSYDFVDEDCDGDGDSGDGIVAVVLDAAGSDPDRGPATVRVRQSMIEMEEMYTVVGEPWNIEITSMKPAIQTGAPTCVLFKVTKAFMAVLGAAEKTPLTAKVTDSDGTVVTAAGVAWKVDDTAKARLAKPLVPTLSSALGVVAPNALCGQTDTGKVIVTATIDTSLDPSSRVRHASVEIDVKGPPANMVLSASPGSLVCDGTATSTVSATLTDAEGNPVVDGNRVRFETKALGVVSPIEASSAGGAATTTLTPLSGVAKGVAVRAISLLPEAEEEPPEPVPEVTPIPSAAETLVPADIEKSILIECASSPGVPAPEAPAAGGAPAISPPATGDGGFLGP